MFNPDLSGKRNQRKSKNLLGLIFFLAIGVALIIGLPQKAVATNMDLGFDDKLWDELDTQNLTYYVKFPQYFEAPYTVSGINIALYYHHDLEAVLFPDNGAGLPDTTNVLLTASYAWKKSNTKDEIPYLGLLWTPFTVNGPGIIETSGPVWLQFKFPAGIAHKRLCVDTNSPDGKSYYYDGDYHQYLGGDYMMRIVVEGVALEHDVLVKEVDIPHRFTVPAEHTIIPRIFVENAGQNMETFDVTCAIDSSGANIYTSTMPVTLEPQSNVPVTFGPWDVGTENNVYDITFYSQLAYDEFPSNDTLNLTVTSSLTDTLGYDYNMWDIDIALTIQRELIVRITPQAYPCKIIEVQVPFWYFTNSIDLELRVIKDANPGNPDTFEPGDIIWSGYRPAIPGHNITEHFDISDENIIIYESDVEAYVCIVIPPGLWYAGDNMWGGYNPGNRYNDEVTNDGCNYLIHTVVSYLPQVGVEETPQTPKVFTLSQNYPNPTSWVTSISYQLPKKSGVSLKLYDVKGRFVKTLADGTMEPGFHSVTWNTCDNNGKKLVSGIYFYRLETNEYIKTRKLIILR